MGTPSLCGVDRVCLCGMFGVVIVLSSSWNYSRFLLPFTVSVANAVPPTQPSSHKEPAGSGEWVGT